ncbi:adrenocortical dysplasia protein homolog [Conger conger]|uniref:adrenocortical dysplasia protein homolog n=1 Tax=Conger conger TaxID=82655 RepID=UPI002A5A83FE|nr:adrenocortical dysplasia protein homolog [Conger conger]XP_061102645.1 adrenocortical dysplasia protein homolog [Conger conger]XP_061102646.1 adrenocortical dysplasia protein homolog [Conger conger]
MIPTKRFSIEPWIEAMVQNYGQQQKAKCLKGYVLEAIELPSSHQQKENAVALLLISDGTVSIPAVLTKQAWEVIQEMEERDTVSGLKKCTTFLQIYSLEFQSEAEMYKSRFFLTIEKLATVAFGAVNDRVPCCTTLPTVKQKICETWKCLQGENSSTYISQSGVCLSDFFMAWFEDEMSSLLAELKTRLALPSSSSPPLPQPSTSRADPPPVERPTHLPTGWHIDRVQYKGQEAFTVPVSHLYIPAEQMEVMQRHPEGRGQLEPLDGNTSAGPVEREERVLPDSGQDGSSLVGSGEQEKGPANPWDIFASAVENLSTSSLEVSLSGSPTPDLPSDEQSPSLLLPLDGEHAAVAMVTSTQASPLGRSSSRELFTGSEQSGGAHPEDSRGPGVLVPEPRPLDVSLPKDTQSSAGSSIPSMNREVSNGSDNQTLPPYQKPRPHTALSCSPGREGSSRSFSDPSVSSTDNPERRLFLRTSSPDCDWGDPSAPQLCSPPPPLREEEEEEEEGSIARKSRTARKKQRSARVESGEAEVVIVSHQGAVKQGCGGHAPKRRRSGGSSPPSWLDHTGAAGRAGDHGTCEAGATGAEDGPALATDVRRAVTTHADGTPFMYRYEPTPQVAKALSHFRVPDDLVRWSVRYLLGPDGPKKTS